MLFMINNNVLLQSGNGDKKKRYFISYENQLYMMFYLHKINKILVQIIIKYK